jgi:hypothetical protein
VHTKVVYESGEGDCGYNIIQDDAETGKTFGRAGKNV